MRRPAQRTAPGKHMQMPQIEAYCCWPLAFASGFIAISAAPAMIDVSGPLCLHPSQPVRRLLTLAESLDVIAAAVSSSIAVNCPAAASGFILL